jgi:hypothetical protein
VSGTHQDICPQKISAQSVKPFLRYEDVRTPPDRNAHF